MIVFFIVMFIVAIAWTAFVVFANGMSDAPTLGFQGRGTILAAWLLVIMFGLAWWFG